MKLPFFPIGWILGGVVYTALLTAQHLLGFLYLDYGATGLPVAYISYPLLLGLSCVGAIYYPRLSLYGIHCSIASLCCMALGQALCLYLPLAQAPSSPLSLSTLQDVLVQGSAWKLSLHTLASQLVLLRACTSKYSFVRATYCLLLFLGGFGGLWACYTHPTAAAVSIPCNLLLGAYLYPARHTPHHTTYLVYATALGCLGTILGITNLITPVHIMAAGFRVTLGSLSYPLLVVANNALTEVYGKAFSQKVLLPSTAVYVLWIILGQGILHMGIHHTSPVAAAVLVQVYAYAPAMLISSIAAYCLSQSLDTVLFFCLYQHTHGKYLYLRSLAAGLVSQFVDTLAFAGIAWCIVPYCLGQSGLGASTWWDLVYVEYLWKCFCMGCSTPLVYVIAYALRYMQPQSSKSLQKT